MLSKLNQYSVKNLWHFTDKSNLDNIVSNGGLLSLEKIRRDGVEVPVFGGNQWSHDADRQKGLDQYVHLAFVDDHPMLYVAKKDERIKEPIWLSIDISILDTPGIRCSTDISNKSGVQIIDGTVAKNEIDFDVLFTYMDWRNPEVQKRRQVALKSEILIPDFVALDKIKGWKNG